MYAVVWGLTYGPIAHLVLGREITIETDHKNLVWLEKAKNNTDKLNRWYNILQRYTYKIFHVSGSSNVVADALSRINHGAEEPHDVMVIEEDLHAQIAAAQSKVQVKPDYVKEDVDNHV